MGLSKLKISFEDESVSAEIFVTKANVVRGLLRSSLTDEGLRSEDDNPLIHIARWTQYPALRAATVGGEIKIYKTDPETGMRVKVGDQDQVEENFDPASIDFEKFLELPEDLTIAWLDKVFDLNPHWVYSPELDLGTEEGKD